MKQLLSPATATSLRPIENLTVCKQFFCDSKFVNQRTKGSFVWTEKRSLVGTLMIVGDGTVSIALNCRYGKTVFQLATLQIFKQTSLEVEIL